MDYVQRGLAKKQEADVWILRGLRTHTAMLALRPSLSKKRLVDVDEQEWAADMPLGTGGKLKEEWLVDRKTMMDEHGRPLEPEWLM